MKKLIMERGGGKSTALVYTSALTGYTILTETQVERNRLVERAQMLGVEIPEPVALTQDLSGLHLSNVLIDDAERVLSTLVRRYTGANVIACTMSRDDDCTAPEAQP